MDKSPNDEPILLTLGYFPPIPWFKALWQASEAHLEQHEHYQKGSFRNRCQIATANGLQTLTVPLRKGKNQQQPIREVHIAYDEPWQIQHWRAIVTAYGSSPFFEHYAHLFEPFFKGKRHELLWDWNYDLLQVCLKILRANTPISLSDAYEALPVGFLDYRNTFHPNARLQYEVGHNPIKYPQVFEDRLGFLPNLSILDLIFCAGRLLV
jgi:hypothetical protein